VKPGWIQKETKDNTKKKNVVNIDVIPTTLIIENIKLALKKIPLQLESI